MSIAFGLGLSVVVVVDVVDVADVVDVVDAGNSVANFSAIAGGGVGGGPLTPRRPVGDGRPGVPPKPLSL